MKFIVALVFATLVSAFAHAGEIEEGVLREMNLARTNPQAYAAIVAARGGDDRDTREAVRFLQKARPLAPLQRSFGLGQGAQLHVERQGSRGGRGHGNCFARIEQFGNWVGRAGENIYYGKTDARGIVCALIIDRGVAGRGHRKNIFSDGFGVAGVAHGYHATFGSMCVIDFAGRFIERGSQLAGL